MSIQCILCKSSDTIEKESIDTKQLAALYRHRADTPVERFFTTPFIELLECNSCGLKFYWPQAIGDGKFYDDLQRVAGYYLREKPEFTEAAHYISSTDDVLEIGSGEGIFTNFIKCKSYTGLEFSEDAIKKASAKGINIHNEGLAQHAATHAERYDVVCYFQVLEHVQHPHSFIADSLKCLKPGGRLLLAVPNEDSFIRNVINFYLNMPPHHASRWTHKALTRLADIFSLEIVKLFNEPLHDIHKKFYAKTRIFKKTSQILGRTTKAVDNKAATRLLYAFATVLSYPASIFLKKNTVGQSVLAVYKKIK
jgi:2-polyprenyl-3-methyl-5-hydroxy-6-metoxy-1,4-benzoquinol methylase